MQCYRLQAMRLQLYHHARASDPELAFDDLALDQALMEFSIESCGELLSLKPPVLRHLVSRVVELCKGPAGTIPACGQYCPEIGGPVALDQGHTECAALHGCVYSADECPLDGWLQAAVDTPWSAISPAA